MASSDIRIDTSAVKKLAKSWKGFPRFYKAFSETLIGRIMLIVWSEVPSYPPPPPNSTYVRTGTLGRSLGTSERGGRLGFSKPASDPNLIYKSKRTAAGRRGTFGTRLDYAPYVIGSKDQAENNKHWWTLHGDVLPDAKPRIFKTTKRAFIGLIRAVLKKTGGRVDKL